MTVLYCDWYFLLGAVFAFGRGAEGDEVSGFVWLLRRLLGNVAEPYGEVGSTGFVGGGVRCVGL